MIIDTFCLSSVPLHFRSLKKCFYVGVRSFSLLFSLLFTLIYLSDIEQDGQILLTQGREEVCHHLHESVPRKLALFLFVMETEDLVQRLGDLRRYARFSQRFDLLHRLKNAVKTFKHLARVVHIFSKKLRAFRKRFEE